MSSVTQPRGPLPARVYWIRRGVVLLVALLLVLTFAKLLGGGSDGKSDADGTATAASGEQSSESAPDRGATPDATAEAEEPAGRKGKKAKKAPLASPDGACDPADVVVEPVIGTVGNDGDIDYKVAVTGAEAACTWTFSNETVALKIVSGSDLIWTSQQCRTLPTRDIVVRSAVERRIALTWDGRRSDSKCSGTGKWALPGSYHVVVAAMGGEPTDVQFRLTRPPTEVVTVTPEPKPSKKASDKPSRRERS